MINRYFAFVVFFALSSISVAFSGEISGTVVDNTSGKPIHRASVSVREINITSITDNKGLFSLSNLADGKYTLKVSFIGYKSWISEITVPGTHNIKIALDQSPVNLDETVSTARGTETKIRDIPGSAEVVDSHEINERNPAGVAEALSRTTGAAVSSFMPWGSQPVLRGMTNEHVVMLVNGNRVVTATAIPAQFGTVANGDIEKIEVLKGPISVLYGSGSTGGIINIITKKGKFTSKPEFGFSLIPTFESSSSGASLSGNLELSSSRVYFSLNRSDRKYSDYRTGKDKIVPNSQFRDAETDVNFGLRFTDKLSLDTSYQDFRAKDVGIPGGSTFPLKADASYTLATRKLFDATLSWKGGTGWLKESSLNFYHQPMDREVKIIPNSPPTVKTGVPKPENSTRITAVSIKPDGSHDVYGTRWQNVIGIGKHRIVAGIESWQRKMESDRTKLIKKEVINNSTGNVIKTVYDTIVENPVPNSLQRPIGIFAEDAFDLGKKLKITIGARTDWIHTENDLAYLTSVPKSDSVFWKPYTDNDKSWSFVGGLVYNLTERLDFNLATAKSFRSPSIEERYLYAELGGKLTAGDPLLNSENGLFVESGLSYTGNSYKLSGQAFVNDINDMVILQPGGTFNGLPADIYKNAGEARLYGFESSADFLVSPALITTADLSYVRGKDIEKKQDLPMIPPLRGHLSARWSTLQSYWTETLFTFCDKQDKVSSGERKTPGYGLFDISLGKNFAGDGRISYDLTMGVKNVFDKAYRDHLTTSRGFDILGMGRSFFVTYKINFR
jgi:hemoglobin/transferrin/lactoferrin receptor protein